MKEDTKKVAIIDYGMGNLLSVKLACEKVGLEAVTSNDKSEIMNSSALILPGVGAFGDAMSTIKKLDLIKPIKKFIDSGRPFFGVCLGMQLLMAESEEFGVHKGLDIIKGKVVRFPFLKEKGYSDKVPQVGWNEILVPDLLREKGWENSLLKGLANKEHMYFVHSFYCLPESKEVVLSETNYAGLNYCSAFQIRNVFACQFHPERSGEKGLMIYKNFADLVKIY